MQRITTKLLQPVDWQVHARCNEVDPEIFFPERGGSSKAARAVCNQCPVRSQCLEYALNNKEHSVSGAVHSEENDVGCGAKSERRADFVARKRSNVFFDHRSA